MGFFLAELKKLTLVFVVTGWLVAYFSERISSSLKVHYLFGLMFCIGLQSTLILLVSSLHRELLFGWHHGFLVSKVYEVDASNGGIRFDGSPINVSLFLVQTLFFITLSLVLGITKRGQTCSVENTNKPKG
jgi:hypothetical protein